MNETEVTAIINARTQSAFSGTPIIFENQDRPELAKGNSPYIKQFVQITRSGQSELGRPWAGRTHGLVVFEFYARTGTGTASRGIFSTNLINSFRSTHDGGIIFQNIVKRFETTRQSWAVSAYQVPFYFSN